MQNFMKGFIRLLHISSNINKRGFLYRLSAKTPSSELVRGQLANYISLICSFLLLIFIRKISPDDFLINYSIIAVLPCVILYSVLYNFIQRKYTQKEIRDIILNEEAKKISRIYILLFKLLYYTIPFALMGLLVYW